MMKKIVHVIAIGILFFLLFTAYRAYDGNKAIANKKNFEAALNRHFEKTDKPCLEPTEWPLIATTENASGSYFWIPRMIALESVGLVKGEDISTYAGVVKMRYTLTEAANPFLREVGNCAAARRLCWGQYKLEKIVDWEYPRKIDGQLSTVVTYHYKIDNLADWAKAPEVQRAFNDFDNVGRLISNVGRPARIAVVLEDQEWKVDKRCGRKRTCAPVNGETHCTDELIGRS
jgi:hypothetical protein